MTLPYHVLIQQTKWFMKEYKDEKKAEHEYTVSLMKAFRCPLVGAKKGKK